ncbi:MULTISPECIES: LysM domain-containing protein [Niallia]
MSVKVLANWNNIENANLIRAGQKLKFSSDKKRKCCQTSYKLN